MQGHRPKNRPFLGIPFTLYVLTWISRTSVRRPGGFLRVLLPLSLLLCASRVSHRTWDCMRAHTGCFAFAMFEVELHGFVFALVLIVMNENPNFEPYELCVFTTGDCLDPRAVNLPEVFIRKHFTVEGQIEFRA